MKRKKIFWRRREGRMARFLATLIVMTSVSGLSFAAGIEVGRAERALVGFVADATPVIDLFLN
ncbi:MAG: hypothetical protein AAGF19_03490 [Pseudomonadota bacterium]